MKTEVEKVITELNKLIQARTYTIQLNKFKSSKTNINYFSNDKDSNMSIVFIHGWQSFWESWNIFGIMDNFSNFNVYAIDLPGHNKSGHIEKYNLEALEKKIILI